MRIPGKGLTSGTGHWLLEGVSSPHLAALEDLICCWWLLGLLPEFLFVDGLMPEDPKDCSEACVDECLNLSI